jgi:UrcA family protein
MNSSANKQAAFFAGMLAFAMAGLACAPSAYSASSGEARSTKVSYGDLNIDSAAGAKTLYARIRTAAATVCAPLDRDLVDRPSYRACIHQSIDNAVAKIDNRMLTSIHTGSKVYRPVG